MGPSWRAHDGSNFAPVRDPHLRPPATRETQAHMLQLPARPLPYWRNAMPGRSRVLICR
jgi:hypothetical protein